MTWKDKYAYRVGDLPHATEIARTEDPDENDGNWPYPTEHITYIAGAGMAEDIRRRAGLDGDVMVVIKEDVISGGYSEYTQENEYPFEVLAGDFSRDFDSLREFLNWIEEEN